MDHVVKIWTKGSSYPLWRHIVKADNNYEAVQKVFDYLKKNDLLQSLQWMDRMEVEAADRLEVK